MDEAREDRTAQVSPEWLLAATRELGIEGALDEESITRTIGDANSAVDREIGAAAAPMTTFLIGVAAGRAADPAVAARDYAQKIARAAAGWHSDEERGAPANEQSARS